jgi:hypothetical protein
MADQHRFDQLDVTRAANLARPQFDLHAGHYDFAKYPAEVLRDLRATFSAGRIDDDSIERALRWKWGHWAKSNMPETHKSLIREVQRSRDAFNARHGTPGPRQTFEFWTTALGSNRRYITRAFLTHLQHPQEVAIIDQHNWRAMRHLLAPCAGAQPLSAAPHTFQDLLSLSAFSDSLSKALRKPLDDVDHFLMQFGKSIKGKPRLTTARRWRSTPLPSPRPR